METKLCMQCGTEIRGRIDKKFCDDQCRTGYHNHVNCDTIIMRTIHHSLRKNRKILKELIPPKTSKTTITRLRLEEKGFCFTYHTHSHTTQTGETYRFCYEYGMLALENDSFILVRQDEQ